MQNGNLPGLEIDLLVSKLFNCKWKNLFVNSYQKNIALFNFCIDFVEIVKLMLR